ncbi:MAG: archaeosortase A [Methanoregula sp.]|jgi:archaeosortase A (PGF-CTERM-specific)|nr:archaeosortase A [Methanoregula sp.]PKL63606.1 MAG: archaeosortase A [Methanomicrobiales archaeon HGW-Methanomicrobiales-3]
MIEYLVLISFIGFLAFLLPGRHRKYAAIVGWAAIILFLFAELPYYFSQNNFLYPLMAVLSLPFLVITAQHLLDEDERVIHLSRAAAVAFLIYAPFGFDQIPLFADLGNALIALVVNQVVWILNLLNFPVTLDAWNIIMHNSFRVEIILGCTGIQSIAIMLGVAAAVPTTLRQKILAFLLIAPTIYILNLLRNVFVIMAYTEQSFPYWPEIASNGEYGYESFFWAHNVIAELLALVCLVLIAYGLFIIIPRLGTFADDLYQLYYGEVMRALGKEK